MVSSASNGFIHTHRKIFNQLLWADTLRGDDSTGVFGVNKEGNVDYLKTVGTTASLVASDEYQKFDKNIFSDYHMVVGHNRKATKGTITDENAHPFVENNTILIHNGTLYNHKDLTKQVVDVDSHAILHSIVERGYEQTMKEIQGAFTLVWYTAEDKTLRVIRNEQRPMFIANTNGAWFFASEEKMLEWILGRENQKIEDMTTCIPGTMYSFKLEDPNNMWMLPIPLYEPKKYPIVSYVKPETPDKKEEEETATYAYEAADFIIGTRILVNGKEIKPATHNHTEGQDQIFYGRWYFDNVVQVRAWVSQAELDTLEELEDDEPGDDLFFTAKIMCVMTKKNRITLICKDVEPFKEIKDRSGKIINEDEFMFTKQKCDICREPLTFKQLENGTFVYESYLKHEIHCPECAEALETPL